MKRIISIIISSILAVTALTLSSCNTLTELKDAVTYPESYSITYEVTSAEGIINTVTKTVDEQGNVYIRTSDKEQLYLVENDSYTLYEKNEEGTFKAVGNEKYTKKSVNEATDQISAYAEESKKQFMPTAKKEGDKELAGRSCHVFGLGVGNEDNGAYYYYYVDSETGICLGMEVRQTALGQELEYTGESFVCTEFVTESIEDLSRMIAE